MRVSGTRNRLWNVTNPYQGTSKKVLCVCSAGLLRSPTAAWVLSQEPYNFNTRACGLHDYALIPIDEVLLTWADEVVVMDKEQAALVARQMDQLGLDPKHKPTVVLDIPDNYGYRDPELVGLIKERYKFTKEERA